jgi:hypothetical protein
MRRVFGANIFLATAILMTPVARPAGIDLHQLWDDRCFECHGHAGEFARRSLSVSNGELHGRHHIHDLRRFLYSHYLADSEVDATFNMLLSQASSQARFKNACSGCHDTAAKFVRRSTEFKIGVLYARESEQPVRDFLEQHQNLQPDDVEFFTMLLTRVADEVYRP